MMQGRGYRWEELGARIRDVRNRAGMTQKDLSALLAVSHHAVWCWEAGKMQPTPEHLTELAQALSVSTDWLLGRDEVLEGLLNEAEVSFRQAVAELPPEDVETIRDFIHYVRDRRLRGR